MGVSQGCLLSPIINYLIQYIHFHSSYVMTYLCVKFKENQCVGTSVTPPLRGFLRSTPFPNVYFIITKSKPFDMIESRGHSKTDIPYINFNNVFCGFRINTKNIASHKYVSFIDMLISMT